MQWTSHRFRRLSRALIAFAVTLSWNTVHAQIVISIPVANVTSGIRTNCKIDSGPPATIPETAKLKIKFVSGDNPPKPAKSSAATVVQLDGIEIGTIDTGVVEGRELSIAGERLANGTVEILRADALAPLCSVVPWPTPRVVAPNGQSYTSFVANGEVGKALKGSAGSDVTGALGIDHRSVPTGVEAERLRNITWWKRLVPWKSLGEELHAMLTIAGSADSLSSADKSAYGAALLTPALSGNGSFQGVTIEYLYFNPLNAAGGTWGPRAKLSVARSSWRVVDTTTNVSGAIDSVNTLHANVPLAAFDLGLRLVFINHLEDPKQNTYSVGFDPSIVWRFVSPNTYNEKRAVRSGLSGSSATKFWGTNVAFWIRLRQVTALADLLYIHRINNTPIAGLTGFQPVVTMKYSSPLFVF